MRKLKIYKIITNSPLGLIPYCEGNFKWWSMINGELLVITDKTLKELKESNLEILKYSVIKTKTDLSPEILDWIKEIQVEEGAKAVEIGFYQTLQKQFERKRKDENVNS